MDGMNIQEILDERDACQRAKNEAERSLVGIKQELHVITGFLSRLSVQAKTEALLLPKDRISNAEKLKHETEVVLGEQREAVNLMTRKAALEREKMMKEFLLHQKKDEIEALSLKVSVWETQQRREIAFAEERTAERQFDIQRFRCKW